MGIDKMLNNFPFMYNIKNLYALDISPFPGSHTYSIHQSPTLETWHWRLDHANYQSLLSMAKLGLLPDISPHTTHDLPKCASCILGK